jgi:hypothetical protein
MFSHWALNFESLKTPKINIFCRVSFVAVVAVNRWCGDYANSYSVKDDIDTLQRNYTYVFNVCGNVGQLPDDDCPTSPAQPTVPAYQISNDNRACYRLGSTPVAPDAQWSLLCTCVIVCDRERVCV